MHKKNENQLKYYQKHKSRLLNDYLTKELIAKERVILQNNDWTVLVPYFAYWPYETIVLPSKRNIKRLYELTEIEKLSLADILKRLLAKYDNLFECSFPYASGWIGKCLAKTIHLLAEQRQHSRLPHFYDHMQNRRILLNQPIQFV